LKTKASSNQAKAKPKKSQPPNSEIKDALKNSLASDLLTKARTNIAAKNYIEAEQVLL
jgi:hypothetical protein